MGTVEPLLEATPFASEKWPFKRGCLSSGVKINTFMFRFTLSSGLSRGGGWPLVRVAWDLKRGFTVYAYHKKWGKTVGFILF